MKLISLFIIVLLVIPSNVYAKDPETLGDLRKIYEDLLAEKKANDNKTEAAKAEIARKEAAISQAQKDLQVAEIEEAQAEQKIEESNIKIEELSKEAETVLLYMQQIQSSNAYVEYISGATSMTEMIMRYEAVEQVTDYIKKTIDDLDKEIENNKKLKIELQEKQELLKNQVETYKKVIKEQTDALDNYDAFALNINQQVELAKKDYESYKETCKQNINRTDDSVKLSECTKIPLNSGWLNPLNKGVITSTIGSRWGSFHNALDIGGNNEGTKVYAAASGRVSGFVSRSSCGGNRIYITVTVGGKKYTTFYYHLKEVYVKVGDIVSQSTVIGTVGGWSTATAHGGYDSCTTGAHLHYGVAEGWYSNHTTKVITPPGFPNRTGYRFSSRTQLYWG